MHAYTHKCRQQPEPDASLNNVVVWEERDGSEGDGIESGWDLPNTSAVEVTLPQEEAAGHKEQNQRKRKLGSHLTDQVLWLLMLQLELPGKVLIIHSGFV